MMKIENVQVLLTQSFRGAFITVSMAESHKQIETDGLVLAFSRSRVLWLATYCKSRRSPRQVLKTIEEDFENVSKAVLHR